MDFASSSMDCDDNSIIDNPHQVINDNLILETENILNNIRSRNNTSIPPGGIATVSTHSVSDDPVKLRNNLAIAFSEINLSQSQINRLLGELRGYSHFADWPKDARTFMQTPRNRCQHIYELAGGKYIHFGLQEAILEILNSTVRDLIPEVLVVAFSTDGGTLDKQGNVHLWPIQVRIHNIPDCPPEFVGIWCSIPPNTKPLNSVEFFAAFVENFNDIILNGLIFEGINKVVRFGPFIADAPARAMALGHMAHNAEVPCSRCKVCRSLIDNQGDKRALRGVDHVRRTDLEYRNREDPLHHNFELECGFKELIGFDIVTNVLFDYMHSTLLGVAKRIFSNLVKGKDNPNFKLNKRSIAQINYRLNCIKDLCPAEFARRPNDIAEYGSMKATELRQILLYSGIVAFRDIMNEAEYFHFLLLSCGIRLLIKPKVRDDEINFAENILKIFVKNSEDFYGSTFLTYNCHVLLHLAEDVRNFGPLDSISAFPYENKMREFSVVCHKPGDYLQSFVNRREESRKLHKSNIKPSDQPLLKAGKKWISELLLPVELDFSSTQYQSLETQKYKININGKDNTFMLKDGTHGIIQNIVFCNNKYKLIYQNFLVSESFFNIGAWESPSFGVFLCSKLSDQIRIIDLENIHGKCFRMPFFADKNEEPSPDNFVVILIESTVT